jgi:hypothetical protein
MLIMFNLTVVLLQKVQLSYTRDCFSVCYLGQGVLPFILPGAKHCESCLAFSGLFIYMLVLGLFLGN